MRTFVVIGHQAPTDPEFALDDLPGGAGRLDVLCRAVGSALFLSHGIREDVQVLLVLQDEVTVRFDGGALRHAHPDERNLASLIRGALDQRAEAIGHQPVETSPGVFLSKRDLAAVLDDLARRHAVVQLHEDGTPADECERPENPAFVLSDHEDFTPAEQALLDEASETRLRLGPERLHADHAITLAHAWLDTDGFTAF